MNALSEDPDSKLDPCPSCSYHRDTPNHYFGCASNPGDTPRDAALREAVRDAIEDATTMGNDLTDAVMQVVTEHRAGLLALAAEFDDGSWRGMSRHYGADISARIRGALDGDA